MDLSKLTPAPWKAGYREGFYYASAHGDFPLLLPESDDDEGKAAIDFACLARNAFDGDPEALAWWEANRIKAIITPPSSQPPTAPDTTPSISPND